jgi:hypothetical protein
MEIDITEFFNEAEPGNFSNSIANLGQDAGRITWENSMLAAPSYNHLDTDEKRRVAREYFGCFGAWGLDEIASWSDQELNALFLQDVAANIRDVCDMTPNDWDWDDYERQCQDGQCSGNLGRGNDGRVYFSIG